MVFRMSHLIQFLRKGLGDFGAKKRDSSFFLLQRLQCQTIRRANFRNWEHENERREREKRDQDESGKVVQLFLGPRKKFLPSCPSNLLEAFETVEEEDFGGNVREEKENNYYVTALSSHSSSPLGSILPYARTKKGALFKNKMRKKRSS